MALSGIRPPANGAVHPVSPLISNRPSVVGDERHGEFEARTLPPGTRPPGIEQFNATQRADLANWSGQPLMAEVAGALSDTSGLPPHFVCGVAGLRLLANHLGEGELVKTLKATHIDVLVIGNHRILAKPLREILDGAKFTSIEGWSDWFMFKGASGDQVEVRFMSTKIPEKETLGKSQRVQGVPVAPLVKYRGPTLCKEIKDVGIKHLDVIGRLSDMLEWESRPVTGLLKRETGERKRSKKTAADAIAFEAQAGSGLGRRLF